MCGRLTQKLSRREVIESFAILTTPASAELADIHRQPAIVDPEGLTLPAWPTSFSVG